MGYEPDNGPERVIPDTYMDDIPGVNWVQGYLGTGSKTEPDNGPEIVIPDSDTYTPADGEWPKCKGTVECNCHSMQECRASVGFKRKCRCNKSKPKLKLLKKNHIPKLIIPEDPEDYFEGTVVCILVGKIVILVHKWQSVATINKFVIAVPS